MGLGPTLVGGIIGAIVGVALHLLVETTTNYEAPWFGIVIGVLTGLGVHQANRSLAGRVSYLRGAVSAAIALAAIVASTPLISLVLSSRDMPLGTLPDGLQPVVHAEQQGDAAPPTAGNSEEEPSALSRAHVVDDRTLANAGRLAPPGINVWQFVFMAIGTFIAYEYGRGVSEPKKSVVETAADSSQPIE